MNYSEMSDFEINKRVAESLGMNARSKSSCVNHGADESGVSVGFGGCMRVFDPCNNPSDAWPIIRIMLDEGATLAINSNGVLSSNFGAKCKGFSFDVDGEPLRSAMIGYLMMQEAKCSDIQ